MDFAVFKDRLVATGYSDDTAYAKIAHDIEVPKVLVCGKECHGIFTPRTR